MKQLPFGTDGIRKHLSDELFIPTTLHRLGRTLGTWLITHNKTDLCKVFILNDTRASAGKIKQDLIAGLTKNGCAVTDVGIAPTPAASVLLEKHPDYKMAIVITASHNPASDNGIKLFLPEGKLSSEQEQEINETFQNAKTIPSMLRLTEDIKETKTPTAFLQVYAQKIINRFNPDLFKDISIILDCAHGSASQIAPFIFKQLGIDIEVINNTPNGTNINQNCGSQYPENLIEMVKTSGKMGIAFDGDADRVIIIAPDGRILDGDDVLTILSTNPAYASDKTYVGTTMTNGGLDLFLHKQGKKLIRTSVGDKHVAKAMQKYGISLGAETSGHIILADHTGTGDGIFAALRCIETILTTDNLKCMTFPKLSQKMSGIRVGKRISLESDQPLDIIESHKKLLTDGRIVVRYSGTESILRIMVESQNVAQTATILASLSEKFTRLLAA